MKKLMLVVAVVLMAVTPAVAESGTQHFFITLAGVNHPTLYEVWITTGERVTFTMLPTTWDGEGWKLQGELSGDVRLTEKGELIFRPARLFMEGRWASSPDEIPLAPKDGMWELPSGY